MFEASGSVANENGDRDFQLQRLDEEAILAEDEDAWRLVYQQAHAGSAPHIKALDFLREHSPDEYESIINATSPDGCELNEDWQWSKNKP